jgi:hypothetical protein
MKRLLLAGFLLCASMTMASAQGLVGPPVDPRYGASAPKAGSATPSDALPSGAGGLMIVGILAALRLLKP